MSLHTESVPALLRTLNNMAAWLDRAAADAEAREYAPENLLQARLAPDQFDLTRNVQAACDSAKFIAVRMGGVEAPTHEDGPATIPELQARITEVRAALEATEPSAFEAMAAEELTLFRGSKMDGAAYVREFAMPNFWFHATMSYAILRHNGVKLGKMDFLAGIALRRPQKA